MDLKQVAEIYMTVKEIAQATGHTEVTVRGWLHYHRFIPFDRTLGKPLVLRSDFREFQKNHPELCKGLLNMEGQENGK